MNQSTIRKEKGKAILMILGLCFSLGAPAQEATLKNWQRLSLQYGLNQVKDKNLHPKVHRGSITQLSYGFEKKDRLLRDFNLSLGYSQLKTSYEDLSKSVNLRLAASYNQSYTIWYNERMNWYLGPQVSLAYNACFFPNWDDSHLYWADYLSIGARSVFSCRLANNREWNTSLSFPLFSVYSRPELYRNYKIDDVSFGGILSSLHHNIQLAHLTNLFFLHFDTGYRFPVFLDKREAFSYSFDFLRASNPDSKTYYQLFHQIGLSFYL